MSDTHRTVERLIERSSAGQSRLEAENRRLKEICKTLIGYVPEGIGALPPDLQQEVGAIISDESILSDWEWANKLF